MTGHDTTSDVVPLVETPDERLIDLLADALGVWPGVSEAEFLAAARRLTDAANRAGEQ